MPYRLDIPGQVSIYQLRAIEAVASLVPPGGAMVEVGSLFGSSSWAWGASVDPTVEVFCIDPWENNAGVRAMEVRFGVKYGLEQFVAYTNDLKNIRPRKGYSPNDFLDWERPIDLYYEDAVHTDPILARNLDFWSSKLRPSGVLCGDDYRPRFPDVRAGAQRLATRFKRELLKVDNFWCLLPNEAECPGADAVAQTLRLIGKEATDAQRKLGVVMSIGPRFGIRKVAQGDSPVIQVRVSNDSLDPWPQDAEADLELWASVHVYREATTRQLVVETTVPIGANELAPDMPVDFDLTVPVGHLPPGNYLSVFTVKGPDGRNADGRDPLSLKGTPFTIDAKIASTTTDSSEGPAASPALASKAEPARQAFFDMARIQDARAKASEPVETLYKLGEVITFSRDGNSGAFKREGWVQPEARHSWTNGLQSRLVMLLETQGSPPLPEARYVLRLEAKPFVVPGKLPSQLLGVLVNGHEVYAGTHDSEFSLDIDVPREALLANRLIIIDFTQSGCRRPCDVLEGSTDQKLLGFAVRRVMLMSVPNPSL